MAASGATASFSTTYITTGYFGDSLQAGVIGGMSAGITYGVAHGATGGTSPFGVALPLAHGVVQGGLHELQGGSFRQGFISGVIGKLGGGIVHANVQTQVLQAGGMVIVSGIAAAASGANSRDAVMRSAISVITVYLYNDIARMKEMNRRSGPTTARDIMHGVSNIGFASDKIATGCLLTANLPCAAFFGGISLGATSGKYAYDLYNESATMTQSADLANDVGSLILNDLAIEALPVQLELPVMIGFDAYGKISDFLFQEAMLNDHAED